MSVMSNKERHTFNVGMLMRTLALQIHQPIKFANEMFVLGCCHETPICDFEEYPYLTEIKEKNNAKTPYNSLALTLLNFAEMHVDETGSLVTIEEKLKRIEEYYGINSEEYNKTKALIDRFCTEELGVVFQQIDSRCFEPAEIEKIIVK